jgi:hypothetical protein
MFTRPGQLLELLKKCNQDVNIIIAYDRAFFSDVAAKLSSILTKYESRNESTSFTDEETHLIKLKVAAWLDQHTDAQEITIDNISIFAALQNVLIALSAIKPLNDNDPVTQDTIDEFNRFVTIDGYQFDINSLLRWIKVKGSTINPYNNLEFKPFDRNNLIKYVIENSIDISHENHRPEDDPELLRAALAQMGVIEDSEPQTSTRQMAGNPGNNPPHLGFLDTLITAMRRFQDMEGEGLEDDSSSSDIDLLPLLVRFRNWRNDMIDVSRQLDEEERRLANLEHSPASPESGDDAMSSSSSSEEDDSDEDNEFASAEMLDSDEDDEFASAEMLTDKEFGLSDKNADRASLSQEELICQAIKSHIADYKAYLKEKSKDVGSIKLLPQQKKLKELLSLLDDSKSTKIDYAQMKQAFEAEFNKPATKKVFNDPPAIRFFKKIANLFRFKSNKEKFTSVKKRFTKDFDSVLANPPAMFSMPTKRKYIYKSKPSSKKGKKP